MKANQSLILIALLLLPILSSAAPVRTEAEAKVIAATFLAGKGLDGASLNAVRPAAGLRSASPTAYYVFNGNDGFVIVSAADDVRAVLGYSDSGRFDFDNLPPNLKAWLDFYEAEINAPRTVATKLPTTRTADDADVKTSVAPLLKTRWGLNGPYNDLAPVVGDDITAPAGSAATAMAQIMNYYQWPKQGAGSHSYVQEDVGQEFSADFGATTYDWENMLERYDHTSSQAARQAVATLVYHCGIAANMKYGSTVSNASLIRAREALELYFGYDRNITSYWRWDFPASEWADLMQAELSAGRPIYYFGESDNIEHAFVCDGYNSDGLFHFNWGYDGAYDGYYEISALNPGTGRVGGGADGFNRNQEMIVGIQPASGTPTIPGARITFDSILIDRTYLSYLDATFNITLMYVHNHSSYPFDGSVGYALFKEDGSMMRYFAATMTEETPLPPLHYCSPIVMENMKLPADIQPGTYRIVAAYIPTAVASYIILMDKTAGFRRSLTLTLSADGSSTIKVPSGDATLSFVSFESTTKLYQGRTAQFAVEVKNVGETEYRSDVSLDINGTTVYEPTAIPPGATKTVRFSLPIDLSPGEHSIKIGYDTENFVYAPAWTTLHEAQITVAATPPSPRLTFVEARFNSPENIDVEAPQLTARIGNSGGLFDGTIRANIYRNESSLGMFFGDQQTLIEQGETKTILLNTPINLPPGDYQAAIYYQLPQEQWTALSDPIPFTIKLGSGNESIDNSPTRINVDPSTLHITTSATVVRLLVYDLTGRIHISSQPAASGSISIPIGNLRPGAYILRLHTSNSQETYKFIKS